MLTFAVIECDLVELPNDDDVGASRDDTSLVLDALAARLVLAGIGGPAFDYGGRARAL